MVSFALQSAIGLSKCVHFMRKEYVLEFLNYVSTLSKIRSSHAGALLTDLQKTHDIHLVRFMCLVL